MNLKGLLSRLQTSRSDFYRNLAQIFDSNQLIRETWMDMAHDMEQQAASLEILPGSLWKKWKDEPGTLAEAIQTCCVIHRGVESEENKSLQTCFASTLNMEEPLILRAYVPIIRYLRTDYSDQALEFYIMVKAHVARLSRLIQPFAGDPVLLQRVANLQEFFEHAVQAPIIPPAPPKKKNPSKLTHSSRHRGGKKETAMVRTAAKARRVLPLGGRAKRTAKRTKALVGKLDLARRRAQR
jgi:hypothetical protein